MQNETWRRRLFSWERVKPSSPVAFSSIVVMDDRHDKAEMTTLVDIAFKENFIQPKYTRLGKDVIFRKVSRHLNKTTKPSVARESQGRGTLLQVDPPE